MSISLDDIFLVNEEKIEQANLYVTVNEPRKDSLFISKLAAVLQIVTKEGVIIANNNPELVEKL